jgi:hypothetical protein
MTAQGRGRFFYLCSGASEGMEARVGGLSFGLGLLHLGRVEVLEFWLVLGTEELVGLWAVELR